MVLDKINPKWALIAVLIGAGGFNSLMAVGSDLTWFNVTWFLSRAIYVSMSSLMSCMVCLNRCREMQQLSHQLQV